MKKINLVFVLFSFLFCACDSNQVKVRGEVEGLKGTVKLLAEMPGKGVVELAEQQVTDGKIDLRTDSLVIPARVWVDVDGKAKVEAILDTKDMIWIKGKIKFPDQIEATGSGIMMEYEEIKKLCEKKLGDEYDDMTKKIHKLENKAKKSMDDQYKLTYLYIQRNKVLERRANYAQKYALANPKKEVCLFLIQDELPDSVNLQKKILKSMQIENKLSNVYKVIENR